VLIRNVAKMCDITPQRNKPAEASTGREDIDDVGYEDDLPF